MALMMDKHGREGFALFCAMLCAAKSQSNEGVFDQQPSVIAAMIRWPLAAYQNALTVLLRKTDWLEVDYANVLIIRSYAKWNAWGGNREGAGRKSSANQVGTKTQSKGVTPASVSDSVSGTKATTTTPPPPAWATALAKEIQSHVHEQLGKVIQDSQLDKWARALVSLTRSRSLDPVPSEDDVATVVRWGMNDYEVRGTWAGWAAQIQSPPSADKFAKIKAAMNRPSGKATVKVSDKVSEEYRR